MNDVQAFLGSVILVGAAMAALAAIESFVAFRDARALGRARVRANLGLAALTVSVNFALGSLGAGLVIAAQSRGFGCLVGAGLSNATSIVIGALALDFATYVAHVGMHKIPALWRVHRVHHADSVVDVTTSFRQHPLEGLIRFGFALVIAITLGLPPEVIAVHRLISSLNALLEHTNVNFWQPLDTLLSVVICTPNMHKVHHSKNMPETDTNYGNVFSLFDRMFGTFTPSSRVRDVTYGLDGFEGAERQSFASLLRLPFLRGMSGSRDE